MFKLAASSLHHALKTLSPALRKRVSQTCLAIPGLNFNHNAVNVRKTCQYQLDHYLLNRTNFVIWHDAVNNSISRHRTNKFNALTPNQLVYCKRVGTENLYSKLKESSILVNNRVIYLISKKEQNLTELG